MPVGWFENGGGGLSIFCESGTLITSTVSPTLILLVPGVFAQGEGGKKKNILPPYPPKNISPYKLPGKSTE